MVLLRRLRCLRPEREAAALQLDGAGTAAAGAAEVEEEAAAEEKDAAEEEDVGLERTGETGAAAGVGVGMASLATLCSRQGAARRQASQQLLHAITFILAPNSPLCAWRTSF